MTTTRSIVECTEWAQCRYTGVRVLYECACVCVWVQIRSIPIYIVTDVRQIKVEMLMNRLDIQLINLFGVVIFRTKKKELTTTTNYHKSIWSSFFAISFSFTLPHGDAGCLYFLFCLSSVVGCVFFSSSPSSLDFIHRNELIFIFLEKHISPNTIDEIKQKKARTLCIRCVQYRSICIYNTHHNHL